MHPSTNVPIGKSVFIAGATLLIVAACTGGASSTSPTPVETPAPSTNIDEVGDNSNPARTPTTEDTLGIPTQSQPEELPTLSDPTSTPPASTPTSTQTPEPTASASDSHPFKDPDYQEELRTARFRTSGWKTDFSTHSVPYSDIFSGDPPRDGIPPIDDPKCTTFDDADEWIEALEPVIALEINGDGRAYPLQIMTWHEIVNDTVGGVPATITFCPLCSSAIAFDRTLDGVVYDFGTSGNLRNSDLVMWDRQTESWWQQFIGEAIVGELTGTKLKLLPATVISWNDFEEAYPEGKVLSRDTGFRRDYGRKPYAGYDRVDLPPFLYFGEPDGRLLPKERVAAVSIGDIDVAFPFSVLEKEHVVNYSTNGLDMAVFFTPDTRSALDDDRISQARSVGATGIFDADLNDQKLTFQWDDGKILDEQTGSEWNILGQSVSGELSGQQLTPIVHGDHFWFAWAAFRPDTIIYQGN